MTDIQKTLAKKEEELQQQLEAVRQTKALFVGKETIPGDPEPEPAAKPVAELVKEVIQEAGKPIPPREVISRIKDKDYSGNLAYVRQTLHKMAKRKELKVRQGRYFLAA